MTGALGAVGSYSPTGQVIEVPPRDAQEKSLYAVGDSLACTICRKQIYEVMKEITTFTKLSELKASLSPWSPDVPILPADAPVRQQPGAALHCPLCKAEWGVVII